MFSSAVILIYLYTFLFFRICQLTPLGSLMGSMTVMDIYDLAVSLMLTHSSAFSPSSNDGCLSCQTFVIKVLTGV